MKSSSKVVAVISISDNLGGAEQVLFKMAKFYNDSGKKVKIIFFKHQTNNFWRDNLTDNVEITYCNNSFVFLLKKIQNQKFDLTFSSHLTINSFLGICRTISVLKTNKLIVRESTSVFGRYSGIKLLKYKFAYWLGYRYVDLIICQTILMHEILVNNLPYLRKRANVKTIPNPFDYPSLEDLNDNNYIQENIIVAAGRLIPEKGFDILIKAFSKFIKNNTDINLMILGEGIERNKLEKLISELNLTNRVFLKGHVANVYPYFKQAKLCVVSSIKEGFPNVLLQMMSQNVKVISTLCAGGIEKIDGIELAETNNIDSLYNALIRSYNITQDYKRELFDTELKKRSTEDFIKRIDSNL